jgi:hypothetical protein
MTDYLSQRFVMRPCAVDAIRYSVDNCAVIHRWMNEPHLATDDEGQSLCDSGIVVGDNTVALVGDWIVHDRNGFFAVSNEVFQAVYMPSRRGLTLRQWVVTAVALHGGSVVNVAPVSRHITLRAAKRAMGRYSAWENPNPDLRVDYQVSNAHEVRV